MKKLFNQFVIASLFLIAFTACEQSEKPGGIPGMGETPGELEIAEPFVAPEGLSIDVKGVDEIRIDNNAGAANLKSATSGDWSYTYGCGGDFDEHHDNDYVFWITTKISYSNISNTEICVTIPKGTVFKVSDPTAQNGILTEDVEVCVKPNETMVCNFVLMCLNRGRPGSNTDLFYEILGTTDSEQIKEILGYLEGKKIGIEYYVNISPSAGLKAANADDFEKYKEIADRIQNTIWKVTNDGQSLSQEDIDYFKSLPDLE